MQFVQIKKLAINVMIGSLVGAAGIAVVAVLAGSFNDILGKALFTLLVVAFHALISLGFIESRNKLSDAESLSFFTNTIFVLIVLSFVTSVFGIWQLLDTEIVGKLYSTYFIAAFAALHGEMLAKTVGVENKINNIVYANYIFMGLVIIMLVPVIWFGDIELGDFYYRLLAAAGIVDATLTLLAVILHKLYVQKHPKAPSQLFTVVGTTTDANGAVVQQVAAPEHKRMHPLLVLLGVYLALQIVGSIVFAILGAAFRR